MRRTSLLHRGFTLIEVIVVVAILAVTAGTLLPFAGTFQTKQTLSSLQRDVTDALRRARERAITGERDSAWGVRFLPASYVVYAGPSYAERTTALDESRALPTATTIAGLAEVTFARMTADPSVTGTLTLTHPTGGSTTIVISAVADISPSSLP